MAHLHSGQPVYHRQQTYVDDHARATAQEQPFLTDVLRIFECSACCSDRAWEEQDYKSGSGRPQGLWDQEEEPVGALSGTFTPLESGLIQPLMEQQQFHVPVEVHGFPVTPAGFQPGSHPTPGTRFDQLGAFHQPPAAVEPAGVYHGGHGFVSGSHWRDGLDAKSDGGTIFSGADFEDYLEDRPTLEVDGGYLYTGQWRGPARHGLGVLERSDGIRYVGTFVDGKAHGRGIFTGADGSAYDGEWDQDHMHGYGKYVDVDGSTYEGEWGQDAKSGRGIESYSDNARYEGEFWMGGKHGAGIYRSGAGVEYEGQYAHDKMDGEGRYKFADGRAYSGQWAVGHMQGFGKMSWPNGSKYEGGYQQDKKHGEGSFTWPDGRMYCGQWRNGQLDGSGVLIDLDGEEDPQEWISGAKAIPCFNLLR
mmetsp:Transcript_90822/g.291130  ORF Transcript_90822/g.291130 Transcript_90822/m.291130 type:complete len:419 (-) Transcript_90822:189-1445(-)